MQKSVSSNSLNVPVQSASITVNGLALSSVEGTKSLLVNVEILFDFEKLRVVLNRLGFSDNLESNALKNGDACEANIENYRVLMAVLGRELHENMQACRAMVKVLFTIRGNTLTLQPVEQQPLRGSGIALIMGSFDQKYYTLISPELAQGYSINTKNFDIQVLDQGEGAQAQRASIVNDDESRLDIDAYDISDAIGLINAEIVSLGSDYLINDGLLTSIVQNPDEDHEEDLVALRDDLAVAQLALQDGSAASESLDRVLSYLDTRLLLGGAQRLGAARLNIPRPGFPLYRPIA